MLSVAAVTALLSAAVATSVSASDPSRGVGPGGAAAATAPPVAVDGAPDITTAVDDLVRRSMTELDIPGAALAIVRHGEVVVLRGYGTADRASEVPVDPQDTVFRIGSVSKALTSIAVHQQLAAGTLTLDAPATKYVDFDIPSYEGSEVTVASLLTHTAGLENPSLGIAAEEPSDIEPLADYLSESVPDRFASTGAVHSYSNWGYGLAGHLVEKATGESFPTYTEHAIFSPLGMTSTTFRPSLPEDIAARMATGYSGEAGERQPEDLGLYLRAYPAGGAVTTAADMVPLMRDLLGDTAGVLDAATSADYLTTNWRAAPTMPGRTQGGMEERFVSGHRTLVQSGDLFTFSAQLALVPDQDLGVFVAYNTFDDQFREDITSGVITLALPDSQPQPSPATGEPPTVPLSPSELEAYTGTYRWTNYPRHTLEKVVAVAPPYNTTVSRRSDGTLAVSFMGLDDTWTYRPIGKDVFDQVSGETVVLDGVVVDPGERIAFAMRDGEPAYLHISLHTIAAERVPLPLMGIPQLIGIAGIGVLFAASLLVWPLGAGIRALRGRSHLTGGARGAVWLAIGVAVLVLGGLGALFLGVSSEIVYGMSPAAVAAPTLLTLAVLGGLAMVPTTAVAWAQGWLSVGGRLFYSLLALAAPLLAWWAWYWNLLGWQW